jgi:(p)ppGpp synthase/HD superfamily hydrolase
LPNKHEDFVKAFKFANDKHWDHTRKGTSTPYIAHPIAVASLVMENGGSSEEVIAALLHDVLEDSEESVFCGHRVGIRSPRCRDSRWTL